MSRLAKLSWVGVLAVFVLAGNARAEDAHKGLWKFLKGEWTFEIAPIDNKGTIIFRMAAGGNAQVARIEGSDGGKAIEVAGWRADTKTYVVSGFDSNGNYWLAESKDVSAEGYTGSHSGILPDGRSFKGAITLKKVDDDHFTWESKGKLRNGEEYTFTGKYARKAE